MVPVTTNQTILVTGHGPQMSTVSACRGWKMSVILGLATGPHGAELAFRRQFWSYNKVTVLPCSHGTLQLGFMALHEAGRNQIHEGLLVGGDKVRLSLLFVDCSR